MGGCLYKLYECTMPFLIKTLSIHRFWNSWKDWDKNSHGNQGITWYYSHSGHGRLVSKKTLLQCTVKNMSSGVGLPEHKFCFPYSPCRVFSFPKGDRWHTFITEQWWGSQKAIYVKHVDRHWLAVSVPVISAFVPANPVLFLVFKAQDFHWGPNRYE